VSIEANLQAIHHDCSLADSRGSWPDDCCPQAHMMRRQVGRTLLAALLALAALATTSTIPFTASFRF
jgi:hypothetical protein